MRTIIIVMGLPGSGKGEVANTIKKQGIPMFCLGDVSREFAKEEGVEYNIQTSEMLSRELRKREGQDAFAKRTAKKFPDKADKDIICVEGARDMSELKFLSKSARLIIIQVDAPDKIRLRRLQKRADKRSPKTFEEFKWRDDRELERGLGEILKTQKYDKIIIKNTGSLKELRKKVKNTLKELITKIGINNNRNRPR